MEQLPENDCRFPCCSAAATLGEIIGLSEWASKSYATEGRSWIYFHCPHCKEACYYLATTRFVEVGYFGAAPVPDFIPIYEIAVVLQIQKQAESLKIISRDAETAVPYHHKW